MSSFWESGVSAVSGAVERLRRALHFGAMPNSWANQRRRVSLPMTTSKARSAKARVSVDSPAARNFSNSSRCGVSWAVAWLRGCRTWVTASASVRGGGVVNSERLGGRWVMIGSWYAQRAGSATVAARYQSKPKGLDVGVIPHCFLLILVTRWVGHSGYLVDLSYSWMSWLNSSAGSSCECLDYGEYLEWVRSGVLSDVCSISSGWIYGGGGC